MTFNSNKFVIYFKFLLNKSIPTIFILFSLINNIILFKYNFDNFGIYCKFLHNCIIPSFPIWLSLIYLIYFLNLININYEYIWNNYIILLFHYFLFHNLNKFIILKILISFKFEENLKNSNNIFNSFSLYFTNLN